MGAVASYRDLDVWQRAMSLVTICYQLAERFPRNEEFGLGAQVRRAAVSIPSNIAEGHGRSSTGAYLHHLAIAHGSLMELETQLEIAQRLGYVTAAELNEELALAGELGRMLHGLIRRLREHRDRDLHPDS